MIKKYRYFIAASVLAILVLATGCEKTEMKEENEQNEVAMDQEAEKMKGLEFPYEIEDGKLIVNSLFQSNVPNPDCNNEESENIATLEIVNQSEKYLASAAIEVGLEDGSVLNFMVSGIPAGSKVWAFETGNNSIEDDEVCMSIKMDTQYETNESLVPDKIEVEVEDTNVKLTNLSDEDLNNLVVDCHCLFDDAYFGGLTYTYSVDSISAGGTAVIEADDCYLGSAEVVRITQGN